MSGKTAPELSVIMVNLNGRAWLPQCLASLRQQTYQHFELIFVDNNSADDSIPYVRQVYPTARIIKHEANLGFAGGNNSGLKVARGKYVVLLNIDTCLIPTTFTHMLRAFQTLPNLGCIQPKLIFMHNTTKLDSCGSVFTKTGFLKHLGNQQPANADAWQHPFPVLSVKGACMMFPRAILNQTDGLFDDDYFCYFEETDFCLRLWLAGYECWYYPAAALYHAMGGVSGSRQVTNAFVQYHSYKNRLTTYLKNLSWPTLIRVLPVCLIAYLAISLSFLIGGQPWNALAVDRSIIYQLVHLPSILRKRWRIQRQVRRRPDRAFLPRITQTQSVRAMGRALFHHIAYEWLQRKLRSNPPVPNL